MLTRRFWLLTSERAVKTFAQALASVLAASGVGLLAADWRAALSTAAMAAVISVLTSVGSSRIGPADSPSAVPLDAVQEAPVAAPPARVAPVVPVVPIVPEPVPTAA